MFVLVTAPLAAVGACCVRVCCCAGRVSLLGCRVSCVLPLLALPCPLHLRWSTQAPQPIAPIKHTDGTDCTDHEHPALRQSKVPGSTLHPGAEAAQDDTQLLQHPGSKLLPQEAALAPHSRTRAHVRDELHGPRTETAAHLDREGDNLKTGGPKAHVCHPLADITLRSRIGTHLCHRRTEHCPGWWTTALSTKHMALSSPHRVSLRSSAGHAACAAWQARRYSSGVGAGRPLLRLHA